MTGRCEGVEAPWKSLGSHILQSAPGNTAEVETILDGEHQGLDGRPVVACDDERFAVPIRIRGEFLSFGAADVDDVGSTGLKRFETFATGEAVGHAHRFRNHPRAWMARAMPIDPQREK